MICDINKAFSTWQSVVPEYHVQYKPQKLKGRLLLSVLTPTDSLTVLKKNTDIPAICLSFPDVSRPLFQHFLHSFKEKETNPKFVLFFLRFGKREDRRKFLLINLFIAAVDRKSQVTKWYIKPTKNVVTNTSDPVTLELDWTAIN